MTAISRGHNGYLSLSGLTRVFRYAMLRDLRPVRMLTAHTETPFPARRESGEGQERPIGRSCHLAGQVVRRPELSRPAPAAVSPIAPPRH